MLSQVKSRGPCAAYDIQIPPAAPILPVSAGDGGISIYTLAAVATGCRFDGSIHCELVPFQQCLGEQHGMLVGLVPSLVSGCGADHVKSMRRQAARERLARQHITVASNGMVKRHRGDAG